MRWPSFALGIAGVLLVADLGEGWVDACVGTCNERGRCVVRYDPESRSCTVEQG